METYLIQEKLEIEKKSSFVRWPKLQRVNLGALLTFRCEIELLARYLKTEQLTLVFEEIGLDEIPVYFDPILETSKIKIPSIFNVVENKEYIWPPAHPETLKWNYGSFKRLALLAKSTDRFPELLWAASVLEKARELYSLCTQQGFSKTIALHLKNQNGNSEESNASLEEWKTFISENPRILFVPLGDDPIDQSILRLQNVFQFDKTLFPLITQLALCSICDGFLGMAAGISTAAVLSKTPYVIFKHPEHHKEEMKIELGSNDCFDFALPKQKIWRKKDNYFNLMASLDLIL